MIDLIQHAIRVLKRTPWLSVMWILGAISILFSAIYFVAGAEKAVDLAFADETAYMSRGLSIPQTGLPPAASSSGYSMWYLILSNITDNPVDLFYFNYKLLTVLIPFLLFAVLWRSGVQIFPAYFLSIWALVAYANFAIQPKVTHFATALILVTLLLASLPNSLCASLAVAAIGSLITSYVRPEFFSLFLLLALACIGCIFLRKENRRLRLLLLVGVPVISILFLSILGFPAFVNDEGRSMCAFGQQFAIRWVVDAKSSLDPALDWQEIISINFGGAESIGDALRTNPSAFFIHISRNILELPQFFWRLISGHFPLFKDFVLADSETGIVIAFFVAMGGVFAWPSLRSLSKRLKLHYRIIILGILFTATALLPSIIMYPRSHYMIIPTCLVFFLVGFLLCGEQWRTSAPTVSVLSACIIMASPFLILPIKRSVNPHIMRPNLATVLAIRSLNISKPVYLLDAEGGYNIYSGKNFTRVSHHHKKKSFNVFMNKKGINAIVVSRGLMYRYSKDPEWREFLQQYPKRGFIRKDISNSGRILLIHRNLISR